MYACIQNKTQFIMEQNSELVTLNYLLSNKIYCYINIVI